MIPNQNDIAIIGISTQLPGCNNIDEFWGMLQSGSMGISKISEKHINNANFINSVSTCEGYDRFDAKFFGYSSHEAMIMDPQQRIFLQNCWHALEHAGYSPMDMKMSVGVFGSCAYNTYLLSCQKENPELLESYNYPEMMVGNDNGYLTTRVSYKLNLTGPSVTVQTACSSTLTALSLACESILNKDSEVCLVGGASVQFPYLKGYEYLSGFINSKDGHCRPFDESSAGTLFGTGAAVIVIKRLEDAIRDHDTIYSVIKSFAINNDGADKMSYSAPSQRGQSAVIKAALKKGNIDPKSVVYIEAHGTGTALGDPVEIAAIIDAYELNKTNKEHRCAIGSVKSNIGHLDAAAGIVGLIKTTLCLYHRKLIPSLHFEKWNPNIDLEGSKMYVNTELVELPAKESFCMSVSSFGVGGTNAHFILSTPPLLKNTIDSSCTDFIYKVSAQTLPALKESLSVLPSWIRKSDDLHSLSFTLNNGRTDFGYRAFIISSSTKTIHTSSEHFILNEKNNKLPLFMCAKTDRAALHVASIMAHNSAYFREVLMSVMAERLSKANQSVSSTVETIMEHLKDSSDIKSLVNRAIIRFLRKMMKSSFYLQVDKLENLELEMPKEDIKEQIRDGAQDSHSVFFVELNNGETKYKLCSSVDRSQLILIDWNGSSESGDGFSYSDFLKGIGYIWGNGGEVLWESITDSEGYRIPAPLYPFQGERFWFSENDELKSDEGLYWSPKWTLSEQIFNENKGFFVHLKSKNENGVITRSNKNYTVIEFNENEISAEWLQNKLVPYEAVESVSIIIEWKSSESESDNFNIFYNLIKSVNACLKVANIKRIFVVELNLTSPVNCVSSVITGFVPAVMLEYPSIQMKLIQTDDMDNLHLIAQNEHSNMEQHVKYYRNNRYKYTFSHNDELPKQIRSFNSGAYLITGGTGNVGLLIGNMLADSNSDLYIISKVYDNTILKESINNRTKVIVENIQKIQSKGSRVHIIKADIGDPSETKAVMDMIIEKHGFIKGIFHSAGRPGKARNYLETIDVNDCKDFFYAKINGILNIRNSISDDMFGFGYIISSNTSFLGGIGDSIYSTVSSFTNMLAEKQSNKWKAICFDYLPRVFEDSVEIYNYGKSLIRNMLTVNDFNAAFSALNEIQGAVLIVSKNEYNNRYSELIKAIEPVVVRNQQAVVTLDENDICKTLQKMWFTALGENLENDDNFFDFGGDSFAAIKIVSDISSTYNIDFSVAEFMNNSTITKLTHKIQGLLMEKEQLALQNIAAHTVEFDKTNSENDDDSIAVIGMSGRFPGCKDINEFWEKIKNNQNCLENFQSEGSFSEKSDKGVKKVFVRGILDEEDVRNFDHKLFNISYHEACLMDPQQRVFLQCAWEALEDAGISIDGSIKNIGVFASACPSSYLYENIMPYEEQYNEKSDLKYIFNSVDSLATMVSYKLNLNGPSKSVQTFCSSSMVAIYDAMRSILNDECKIAMAGGVNIITPQKKPYLYRQGSILSPTGFLRPFDDRADGTVFSNGAGVVILKKLSEALKDKDHVYGVISGGSINNDGSSKAGYMAPSEEGQMNCIKDAYHKSGIQPESVCYVETHGTGTRIGDAIEASALIQAFPSYANKKNYCVLGSVKGNIGHTDRAAGVLSFIKCMLMLSNREMPPIFNADSIENKSIAFGNSPFCLNRELIKVDKSQKFIIGLSGMGVGGTNVHLILSEVPPKKISDLDQQSRYLVKVTGKNSDALIRNSIKLSQFLRDNPDQNLSDVANTLLKRSDLNQRACFSVATIEEFIHKLEIYDVCKEAPTERKLLIINKDKIKEITSTIAQHHLEFKQILNNHKSNYDRELLALKEFTERLFYSKTIFSVQADGQSSIETLYNKNYIYVDDYSAYLEFLAYHYRLGMMMDWNTFLSGNSGNKTFLPFYAFEREYCWIEIEKTSSLTAQDKIDVLKVQNRTLEEKFLGELENLLKTF
ncbi:SDR family NAD(P)-dependent oxidoreductase [Paenibacillus tundrae]|uniref:SDR family NAD(P)-dependent oxidoreductase n=1 Tax=Paenibacillus tundrae TaxID=528187 RepID=UPI0022A98823|nr:SDR family NAD(P)-dependent oxidoreductase [Paenibacillus tundrae]MCZ1264767.1 SDR family NAD(P)-dependent oxidoreductase [Paenibacillus tundrae]